MTSESFHCFALNVPNVTTDIVIHLLDGNRNNNIITNVEQRMGGKRNYLKLQSTWSRGEARKGVRLKWSFRLSCFVVIRLCSACNKYSKRWPSCYHCTHVTCWASYCSYTKFGHQVSRRHLEYCTHFWSPCCRKGVIERSEKIHKYVAWTAGLELQNRLESSGYFPWSEGGQKVTFTFWRACIEIIIPLFPIVGPRKLEGIAIRY